MAERRHPALAPDLVRSHVGLALRQELARVRFADPQRFHRWRATTVTEWIGRHGFGRANVLHGFISNLDPSLVRTAGAHGLLTIGDQIIAPAAVQVAEQRRQLERWPGWEDGGALSPERTAETAAWERQSWDALDHITCPSGYVRAGLLAEGVAPSKISMLPYPSPLPIDGLRGPPATRAPPTIGFVGAVGLRKGSPYFVEVARRFGRDQASFVMVGAVRLSEQAARSAREAVELVGHVPRSAIREWLAGFDLFFFPSTCEGSASAVVEAMAAGLPVITSPNSGSIIRDGEDGYLVPYDDLDQAEARIAALIADPGLRRDMGEAARRRVAALDLDWYGAELAALIGRLHNARMASM
jgi:glycosyltransferase involved in cell wall biosynthesis